ncbi:ribonuclease E/G [Blattabacterium sp. (Cryptocercus kyebangensis)]|uniref:Rne/Rng family ribonuclease n=1 Tax=Blattabacterium sp. (Cryptocercus kyebangensis) TaxID=298656 RepID=UPI000D7CE970|nr:Rne/Rng family ribonuclease [Blattabacterium sp. (Cryptocercus kyebangensis)]AWU43914.1 ribonuclease E/G [Blattabacterium sp. (Cryptocercus kyebangensis)]
MIKELVINAEEQEVKIALLEEGKLLELHQENYNKKLSVGDIYLGIVKKISYALNAAIIDIGYSKGAFLHYDDLGFQIEKMLELITINQKKFFLTNSYTFFLKKKGDQSSIEKILYPGQKILVQISKEPISNKGPKLTAKICIPGRNLVLIPFSEKVSISHKIKNVKEKNRLILYMQKIKPKEFGIIIRTVACFKIENILKKELFILIKKWKKILSNLIKLPPVKVLSESNKTSCLLRDTFNDDFKSIYCNNSLLCQEIHSYLSFISPEKTSIIKYYKGNIPIFEKYGIEKQIQTFLGKNVPLGNGAYLVIEHTEALHVIDVNSGMINHIKKNCTDSERVDHILQVNLLAATEIARQLRLRDMGGIIVVDFIDMSEPCQKKKLYEHIKEKMKNDRATHQILPPNEFGLVQFTRHRVRPELKYNEKYQELESPIIYIHNLEFILEKIMKNKFHKGIQLHIHSFVEAYLKKGFPSIQQKWFFKYKKWIKIIPRNSFKYTEYQILNKNKEIVSSSFI